MKDDDIKVDVDFNEALRRIAHTPKSIIDNKNTEKETVPPKKGDTEKDDKQSRPKK